MKLDSDTMNATQRCRAIINHEDPDRCPIYVMGIPEYSKCFKEFKAKEDSIFDSEYGGNEENILLTPLGDYTMRYYFGGEVEMCGIHKQYSFNNIPVGADGRLIEDTTILKSLTRGKEANYVDYLGKLNGIKILDSGEAYNWYIDGFLKKKEDALAWYDRWGWPQSFSTSKAQVAAYGEFKSKFGDRIYMIPQIGGMQLYESTWVIMGQARWAYYCRNDPDYIHKLVNSRKEAQLQMLDEIAKYKPEVVFGGDDMGQKGRPLLSPEMYRKFFKEPYREIFQKVHDMGAKIFNHSCGNIVELLPDMIEAGLDGWQSLEPAALVDHDFIKKKYGDKLFFVGGIDSREISFGSKESLEKHVETQIRLMGKKGGYIPGPTHDFLTETPLENCLIMRDAIHKYSKSFYKNE